MEEENTFCDDDHQTDILLLNIPQDVFIQILVLLPVISLLRFKSVCKSWRVLIQSSHFINLHLNTTTTTTTTNNNNFGSFIYQTDYYLPLEEEKKNEAFMLSSSAASGGGDDNEFEKLLKLEDLGFPPRYKVSPVTHDIFMVGSCNGLICIHETKRREVSLWNPATRQFRLLPKSLILAEGIPVHQDFVAFGYDVKTKDYKVVLISHFTPYSMGDYDTHGRWLKDCIFRLQVYSLSTNSWRLLEGINSLPAIPRQPGGWNHGVYLKNGSYYFLGTYFIDSKPNLMLLSFDFTKEIFTTIQLPPDSNLATILTSFGEKQLAVFAQRLVKEDAFYFITYDIWVLNEHHGGGVKEESWTKLLHSIRLNCSENYIRGIPKSISNNGEFALIYTEGGRVINGVHVSYCHLLQLFNLVTQEVKKEFRTGTVLRAEVYKQSLVSMGGNDTTADRVIGAEM